VHVQGDHLIRLALFLPTANALSTDYLQKPLDGIEQKSRGRLRLSLKFSEFLDGIEASKPSSNSGGPTALINQHEIFWEFGEWSQATFPYVAEITDLRLPLS
jgi:hypothetical protein